MEPPRRLGWLGSGLEKPELWGNCNLVPRGIREEAVGFGVFWGFKSCNIPKLTSVYGRVPQYGFYLS